MEEILSTRLHSEQTRPALTFSLVQLHQNIAVVLANQLVKII
jgi:hypothetical protein